MTAVTARTSRRRIRVTGTVQGVGFRPHVHRLATGLGLAGHVLNDAAGVLIEIEGDPAAVAEFEARLGVDAPPLARIEAVRAHDLRSAGRAGGFAIRASPPAGRPDAAVTPDSATCPECLAELFDPGDRRYRYPFVNCTNCGPRFTIVRGIPYDRPLTTMAPFTMCAACRAEYEDPGDRRFHAQPNACPACGPAVALIGADGRSRPLAGAVDAVAACAELLRDGAIVAVKGLGGYHLACRAADPAAVARLRARKHREEKPFAVMAGSMAAADKLVVLSAAERALLSSAARPIVLAARRPGAAVADAVAPGAPELGVMLPYTPLHHLLLADLGEPVVLTSGNVSDEPIAFRDGDARDRLAGIADALLVHDRKIETRTDDSVLRVVASPGGSARPVFVRRSRGYVPAPLTLPIPAAVPVLACGAELKNTFTLVRGERAWVSHHIGDLQNAETVHAFAGGVAHLERLFGVSPQVIAHDLHPQYLSSQWAAEQDGVRLVAVQHHHAHLAAVLAERGVTGPAVGAIFDGSGLGTDGTVWGGELLVGDLVSFARAGSLAPVRLPGGEAAIRQPWRMACAWLCAAGGGADPPPIPRSLGGVVDPVRWRQVARLAGTGVASPVTTSVGRLFDAVAAIAGLRAEVTYEGQAAVLLEAACDPVEVDAYPLPVRAIGRGHGGDGGDPRWVLDATETVRAAAGDAGAGVSAGRIAARFHAGLAAATATACAQIAGEHGIDTVVLGGGVFLNRRLLGDTAAELTARGLRVLVPERLPPGDGGISFGQAAVAAARGAER